MKDRTHIIGRYAAGYGILNGPPVDYSGPPTRIGEVWSIDGITYTVISVFDGFEGTSVEFDRPLERAVEDGTIVQWRQWRAPPSIMRDVCQYQLNLLNELGATLTRRKELQGLNGPVVSVAIYRASEGTLSGQINFQGIVDLTVTAIEINHQLTNDGGNGSASAYIREEPLVVDCVKVGGIFYKLGTPLKSSRERGAEWEITIHHDNPAKVHLRQIWKIVENES